MFTKDDLVDLLFEALAGKNRAPTPAVPEPGKKAPESGPRGRVFLSEYEIRRRLTGGARDLRIPRGAIISPLAQDWLQLQGIRIVEE